MELRTISITVARPVKVVYEYLAAPEKYSEWSFFLTSARPEGDRWIFETPNGPVHVKFVERNAYGVLDHWVTVGGDAAIYVPLRVVAHGHESAVLFTVFRQSEMSDQDYDADIAAVRKDLENLKRVLESA
jgi:hypothetical protein